MFTVWFNDSNTPKSEIIQSDYEIHEIPEVIQIVRNLK